MDFKKINLEDKNLFDDYFRKYPPNISELTFTNLFCWRHSKKYAYAIIDNHLLISYEERGTKKYLQPVGETPELIIAKVLSIYPKALFERVEGHIAEKLKDQLKLSEPLEEKHGIAMTK